MENARAHHRGSGSAPLDRLRAVLLARHGETLEGFGQRIGTSAAHLRAVASGRRRAGRFLTEKLLAELGPSGWAFVSGASDTLEVGR